MFEILLEEYLFHMVFFKLFKHLENLKNNQCRTKYCGKKQVKTH
jgi:hypothetical protein